jgi:hypothetical protein
MVRLQSLARSSAMELSDCSPCQACVARGKGRGSSRLALAIDDRRQGPCGGRSHREPENQSGRRLEPGDLITWPDGERAKVTWVSSDGRRFRVEGLPTLLCATDSFKGRKDRFAMLSPKLLELLRDWYLSGTQSCLV